VINIHSLKPLAVYYVMAKYSKNNFITRNFNEE